MNLEKIKDSIDSLPIIRGFIRKLYSITFGKVVSRNKQLRLAIKFDQLVHELASDDDVVLWPAFGTLLGIYRDGGIISHDNDIDFAAWYDDRERVRFFLESHGCKLIKKFSSKSVENAYEEQYLKDGVQFDVFYFCRGEGVTYTHDFMRHQNLTRVQTRELLGGLIVRRLNVDLKEISKYKFKGKNINFPENVAEHLAQRYGDDFMIPNPTWTASNENPNIQKLSTDGELFKYID